MDTYLNDARYRQIAAKPVWSRTPEEKRYMQVMRDKTWIGARVKPRVQRQKDTAEPASSTRVLTMNQAEMDEYLRSV